MPELLLKELCIIDTEYTIDQWHMPNSWDLWKDPKRHDGLVETIEVNEHQTAREETSQGKLLCERVEKWEFIWELQNIKEHLNWDSALLGRREG